MAQARRLGAHGEDDGAFDVGDRAGDFAANQVEAAQLRQALGGAFDLLGRQDAGEQVAGVEQRDQCGVPRIGNVVCAKDGGETGTQRGSLACIQQLVVARAEPVALHRQHLPRRQRRQSASTDGPRLGAGQFAYPATGVESRPAGGDGVQHIVEGWCAGWRAVDDVQAAEVGVDALGERQVEQRRAGPGAVEDVLVEAGRNASVVQRQQGKGFGEAGRRAGVRHAVRRNHVRRRAEQARRIRHYAAGMGLQPRLHLPGFRWPSRTRRR